MPFVAVLLAFSGSFSPRLLERSALTPTPAPTATATIMFWAGKASETAVRASSLRRDTKMLSTTL